MEKKLPSNSHGVGKRLHIRINLIYCCQSSVAGGGGGGPGSSQSSVAGGCGCGLRWALPGSCLVELGSNFIPGGSGCGLRGSALRVSIFWKVMSTRLPGGSGCGLRGMALEIVSKGEKVHRYSYMLRCMTRAMARAAIFIVMMD
jgi:hypothetical protein